MEFVVGVGCEPVNKQVVDSYDRHLARLDSKIEDSVGGGFVIAEQVSALGSGACNDLDGLFDGP